MQHHHYSRNLSALLFALPLLMGSLPGLASDYTIGFGTPSQESHRLVNGNTVVWTYSTTGTVSNFSY